MSEANASRGGVTNEKPHPTPTLTSFAVADPFGSAFLTLRTAAEGRLRLPLQGRVTEPAAPRENHATADRIMAPAMVRTSTGNAQRSTR
jgi:hypothetical protein